MTAKQSNERLRSLLDSLGESNASFAAKLEVDQKTVQRWIANSDRAPHPRMAHKAAKLLNVEVTYLWPDFAARRRPLEAGDELIACYPGRAAIPEDLFGELLSNAEQRIEIIGDFGLASLVPDLAAMLTSKASSGVFVSIVLSDPSQASDPSLAATASRAEAMYRPLADETGIGVSSYLGTLHTVMLRVDDIIVARMPLDGCPTAFAPFMHLRVLPGGQLSTLYLTSLDAIKEMSIPVQSGGRHLRVVA